MKRSLAALLLALPALQAPAAQEKVPAGSVERLQVTSVSRTEAALWVHTLLPDVAEGARQTFSGDVEFANVKLPVRGPMTVAVQPRAGRKDAVFFLDLPFRDVPPALLAKIGTHSLDIELNGVLHGDNNSSAQIFAVGVLRYGTSDIETPWGTVDSFIKFGGARLTGLSLATTNGEAGLTLYNPFPFALPIREITYALYVGDRRVAGGEKKALRVHQGRDNAVQLPIAAQNLDLAAAAGNVVKNGGTVQGRLVANIVFKAGRDAITLPINLPGTVRLVK